MLMRLLGSVSGLPTPRTLLGMLLVADVTALGVVIVAVLAAVGLLGAGIDVTGMVAALMYAGADVLSTTGPPILGGWLLYAYVYLFVGLLAGALLCRSQVTSAVWAEATRLLPGLLTRIAPGRCHHYPKTPHPQIPSDVLRHPTHDRSPSHLATGWTSALHPALTYE